ncbi:MAG: hypothetical protein V4489_05650 [Chlamydiota bacterium]
MNEMSHVKQVEVTSPFSSNGTGDCIGVCSLAKTPKIVSDTEMQGLFDKVNATKEYRSKPDQVLRNRIILCTAIGACFALVPAILGFLVGCVWGGACSQRQRKRNPSRGKL